MILVLDLNGILIRRKWGRFDDADFFVGKFSVYRRPNITKFLKFCVEKFDVVVWSTMNCYNTNMVVDLLFETKPMLVLHQEHCLDTGKKHEYKNKHVLIKPLSTLWQYIKKDDAVFVDDDLEKICSNDCKLIIPPTWDNDNEFSLDILTDILTAIQNNTVIPESNAFIMNI